MLAAQNDGLNIKNKSRIVLINLPTHHLKSDTEIMSRGILSVHSYLKRHGIDSILVDLAGLDETHWKNIPESGLYGISAVTCQIVYAQRLAYYLKSKAEGVTVIMGGAHPTALPLDCLKNRNADIVVCGEGEKTVFELMTKKNIYNISGLYYREGNRMNFTGPRILSEDIEEFYPLSYEDYDIHKYLAPKTYKYLNANSDDRQMNFTLSRGCPGQCIFCLSGKGYTNKVRYRNMKSATQEIRSYIKRYRINRVYFDDDGLVSDREYFKDLCNEMRQIKIDWLCLMRADQVNEALLCDLKDSGCVALVLGIESFDNGVLKYLNKFADAKINYNAIMLAYKYGIKIRAQMMVGCLPEENATSVRETGEFVRKIIDETRGNTKFSFHIFQPLPGTVSYQKALKSPDVWDTESLLDFSEFQTIGEFYKTITAEGKPRPYIAHRNREEVFEWYDYLVGIADDNEISALL